MSVTGTPAKLIWVAGFAVSVSGAGETCTVVPASVALGSRVAGRHAGEAPLGGTTVCAPERLPVPSTIATTTHARAATSRTMYRLRLMCAADLGRPAGATGVQKTAGARLSTGPLRCGRSSPGAQDNSWHEG